MQWNGTREFVAGTKMNICIYENDDEQEEITAEELARRLKQWTAGWDKLKKGENCIINDTTGEFLSWGDFDISEDL